MAKARWAAITLLVALFAAALLVAPAYATGSVAGTETQAFECSGNNGTKTGSSPMAACTAAHAGTSESGSATATHTVTSCGDPGVAPNLHGVTCQTKMRFCVRNGVDVSCSDSFGTLTANVITQLQCPGNSTLQNGSCMCNGAFKPNPAGTQCIGDCAAKEKVSSGYYDIGPNSGANPQLLACAGACEAVFDGVAPAGSGMVNGVKHWYAKGSYFLTGGTCTSSLQDKQIGQGSGTTTKPPDTCAPGQAAGTVNGKGVCVDQSGDGKTPTDASKNQATSGTEKTRVTNPDGSVTETEVRTRVDANGNKETTTTTTTTRPDGSSTTTRQVDNPLPGSILGGGTGNGTGTGTGTGTEGGSEGGNEGEEAGPCEKNPSEAGCGGEAASIGELYAEKGKTLSSVLTTARDNFLTSPIGTAAGGFFVVSNPGACPTFSGHIPFINADLHIDQFCTPFATQALLVLKMAVILVCSFLAFRVAVE